jgi:hypothetical protein
MFLGLQLLPAQSPTTAQKLADLNQPGHGRFRHYWLAYAFCHTQDRAFHYFFPP